jgi:plastocyanin
VSTAARVHRLIQLVAVAGALPVVILAGAACGATTPGELTPATATSDGTQHVTISVADGIKFQPAAVSVRAGQPFELTFRNTDASAHDITLNDAVAQPVKLMANGGETTSGTVTFDTPGHPHVRMLDSRPRPAWYARHDHREMKATHNCSPSRQACSQPLLKCNDTEACRARSRWALAEGGA